MKVNGYNLETFSQTFYWKLIDKIYHVTISGWRTNINGVRYDNAFVGGEVKIKDNFLKSLAKIQPPKNFSNICVHSENFP